MTDDELAARRAQLEAAGATARKAVALRDELILAALGLGLSQREVARLVGLSHTAVQAINRRAEASA